MCLGDVLVSSGWCLSCLRGSHSIFLWRFYNRHELVFYIQNILKDCSENLLRPSLDPPNCLMTVVEAGRP